MSGAWLPGTSGVGGVSFLEFRYNTCGDTKCIPCPNRSDTSGQTTAKTEAELERWRAELKQMDLRCTCGGEHISSAPLRCPKCRSTGVAEGRRLGRYGWKTAVAVGTLWPIDRVKNFRNQHGIPHLRAADEAELLTGQQAAAILGVSRHGLEGLFRIRVLHNHQTIDFASRKSREQRSSQPGSAKPSKP